MYALLFQPRSVESRDAGPWIHRRNLVYGGLTVVMCDGAEPLSPVLFKGQLCFYLQPHSWVVQWPGLLQPQHPECPADFRHLRIIFRGGLEEEESLSPEGPYALSQLWCRGALKTEYMTANICASGTFPGCLHYR